MTHGAQNALMDVISKAKSQLATLQGQIASLKAKQDRLSQFISTFEELRALPDEGDDLVAPAARLNELATSAAPRTAKVMIADAARQILSDGAPKHTRDLLSIMEKQGIAVGGKDKVLALSAILSKDDDFQASRKVGWSLKKAEPVSVGAETGSFFSSGSDPDPTP